MANKYFQFKQFRVDQDMCGMSVTTESCIMGSWIPVKNATKVLDIGTGTGVLSLMIAQRSNAAIYGVELEKNAYLQAERNFKNSPWSLRLNSIHSSVQKYASTCKEKFDLIVSNPPYFSNHQKSGQLNRNLAMHADSLSQGELLDCILRMTSKKGLIVVMYPPYEADLVQEIAAEKNWYPSIELRIKNRADDNGYFRLIRSYSYGTTPAKKVEDLNIRVDANLYTKEFIELLKPYYLHL